MNITEKAAYIKGLAEGLGVEKAGNEGKVLSEMLDLLSEMAEKLSFLEGENRELRDYIEELDEDLGAVEEDFYCAEDEYDDDDEYDEDEDEDEDDEDGDDDGYYEVVCPSCGETVCFDESLDPDELVCPACGEKIGGIELCDGNCDGCAEDCEDRKD